MSNCFIDEIQIIKSLGKKPLNTIRKKKGKFVKKCKNFLALQEAKKEKTDNI